MTSNSWLDPMPAPLLTNIEKWPAYYGAGGSIHMVLSNRSFIYMGSTGNGDNLAKANGSVTMGPCYGLTTPVSPEQRGVARKLFVGLRGLHSPTAGRRQLDRSCHFV